MLKGRGKGGHMAIPCGLSSRCLHISVINCLIKAGAWCILHHKILYFNITAVQEAYFSYKYTAQYSSAVPVQYVDVQHLNIF